MIAQFQHSRSDLANTFADFGIGRGRRPSLSGGVFDLALVSHVSGHAGGLAEYWFVWQTIIEERLGKAVHKGPVQAGAKDRRFGFLVSGNRDDV